MVKVDLSIDIRGTVFEAGMQRGLLRRMNEGLDEVAKIGEGDVKSQLYPGHGFVTGNLREAVAGDLIDDLVAVIDAGEHIQGKNIVYAEWIEAGKSRRPTRFRGYRMFARTTRRLRDLPVNEIIGAKIVRFLR